MPNIAEQFFSSVYPTISSGQKTKMIIVSTPHGMNMFYKLWVDAQNKQNDYIPIEVHWSEMQVVMKNGKKKQYETLLLNSFNKSLNVIF